MLCHAPAPPPICFAGMTKDVKDIAFSPDGHGLSQPGSMEPLVSGIFWRQIRLIELFGIEDARPVSRP